MDIDLRRVMPRYSEEIKQQARELYAQGLSRREIGRWLGVPHPTVGCWVNPAVAKRGRERNQQWRQENPEQHRERSRLWRKANPERQREHNRRWHEENNERSRERSRLWHQENPERSRELNRRWREANREHMRAYMRAYDRHRYTANPEKAREKDAFRRAAKKQATPPWLTLEHRKQMRDLHAEARRLKKVTGVQHHVDHIIPLHAKFDGRGKQIACGLHVPWNLQVMPGPENCSKQCALPGPEDWTAP